MQFDGTKLGMTEETCNNMKTAISKYGISMICDENKEEIHADVVLPANENCDNMKEVASKFGVAVLCEE